MKKFYLQPQTECAMVKAMGMFCGTTQDNGEMPGAGGNPGGPPSGGGAPSRRVFF